MAVKTKLSMREIIGWILLGVSVIMLVKSFTLCFSKDIWYDELFTIGLVERSYGELIRLTAQDVHPPFYYCIVKLFFELCKLFSNSVSTIVVAKCVSVLPYFGLLVYSLTYLKKRFGIFVGGMFLFCVIAMPQLSAYTVEVRMYGFALFFVTAALLHAFAMLQVETEKKRRLHRWLFILFGLAAAYTQYFACVAVIMVYLYVFISFCRKQRERLKEWFLCVFISVLGYLPWLFSLIAQMTKVNENYWILPLTWRSIGGCVKFLLKPSFASDIINTIFAIALFLLYAFLFLMLIKKVYRNGRVYEKEASLAVAALSCLLGLVLFGFVASFLLRPIFVYRYMLPAVGGFWLCFAISLDVFLFQTKGDKLWRVLCLVLTLFLLVIGCRNYLAFMGEEEYKTVQMKDTEIALSNIKDGDVVIFNFDQVQMTSAYYLTDKAESYLWYGESEMLIREILSSACPIQTLENVEDKEETITDWLKEGKNVWFIGSFNSREDIVEEWRESGLGVTEEGSYLLERYWFNLYKVSL